MVELSREELIEILRKELPNLLATEPSIRYEVMGILAEIGVKKEDYTKDRDAILEAIKGLREDFNRRFEEHSRVLTEHSSRIEELARVTAVHSEKIDTLTRSVEELVRVTTIHSEMIDIHSKKIDTHSEKIDLLTKSVEELVRVTTIHSEMIDIHSKKIDTHSEKIDLLTKSVEQLVRVTTIHSEKMDAFARHLDRIGARWGIFVEDTFRVSMKEILEKEFGAKVEELYIDGYQIDLLVKDSKHLLIEITSSTKAKDIENLLKAAEIYRRDRGIEPKLILVTAYVPPTLYKKAKASGIEILSHEKE